MWTNDGINLYFGDCRPDDRAATADEIEMWEASRSIVAKTLILNSARELREKVLNRLTGIQLNTADQAVVAAIQAARTDLLNITTCPSVVSATDSEGIKAAVMAEWSRIALALVTVAPSAASTFKGLDV